MQFLKTSFHYLQTELTTADRKVSCGKGQECAQHTSLQSELDSLVDNIKAHPVCKCFPLPVLFPPLV